MTDESNEYTASNWRGIEDKLFLNFSYIGGLILSKATKIEKNPYNKEMDSKSQKIISVIYQTQGSVTILIISMLFVFLVQHPKLRNRNSTKLFMNLQLVQFCMACTTIVAQHTRGDNITQCINNGFLLALFLGMLMVTVDRHAQIHRPMVYQNVRTKQILLVVIATWLLAAIFDAVILARSTFHSQLFLTYLSTVLLLTTHVVLVFTNISVVMVAKRHQKHIQSMYKTSSIDSVRRHKQSLKATKTCITIVGSYLLLWLPFLIHNLLSIGGYYIADGRRLFSQLVEIVALSNAIVDQMLFVAFHKEVKKMAAKYIQGSSSEFDNFTSNRTSSLSSNRSTTSTTPSYVSSSSSPVPTLTTNSISKATLEAIKEWDEKKQALEKEKKFVVCEKK